MKGAVTEEEISKQWHAALCSVVGNVSMSVKDWARGWTGRTAQQVKVLMY